MKKEVNPILIGVILVLFVGALAYFGWKSMLPPEPPAGSYTPGLPPWKDPLNPEYKKAHGGSPGGPAAGAPGGPSAAAPNSPVGSPSGGAPAPPPQGRPSGG